MQEHALIMKCHVNCSYLITLAIYNVTHIIIDIVICSLLQQHLHNITIINNILHCISPLHTLMPTVKESCDPVGTNQLYGFMTYYRTLLQHVTKVQSIHKF